MARPVWTGSISFGMVSIPIRLVPAVRRKSISFNQIDDQTMSRVRYRKVSEATGEEVSSEHIVKGYDMGGESYVLITDDDLAPLQPAKSKEIDLDTFVPEADVNPLMFDSSYIIVPDKNAKPYALLANAMAGSGRVGIGRFVMRQKEYLAAVRSDGTHLTLSTLVFPDELVEVESTDGMETLDEVEITNKELLMAKSLVDALSEDFQPAQLCRRVPPCRRADHRRESGRQDAGVRRGARGEGPGHRSRGGTRGELARGERSASESSLGYQHRHRDQGQGQGLAGEEGSGGKEGCSGQQGAQVGLTVTPRARRRSVACPRAVLRTRDGARCRPRSTRRS